MKTLLTIILLNLGAFSCAKGTENSVNEHGDHDVSSRFVEASVYQSFQMKDSFRQVGVSFDSSTPLEYEDKGIWKKAPLTFQEGEMKVAVIKLDSSMSEIRFRSAKKFENATFQFYPKIVAKKKSNEVSNQIIRALAPDSLVISRRDWGARDPDRKCGQDHIPKFITVHHTALPDNDGPDPAARLRQMQAYHMDSNGWCDIGYHFVVSKSGKIYQGMSSEKRSGIHVRNHNFENIGIALIGNFEEQTLENPQLGALVKILSWAADTYKVPFRRPDIKGHREWSGASTACPGTNTIEMLDEIIALASEQVVQPPPPCPVLEKSGGIIDNDSSCLQLFGNLEFWRSENVGFGGTLRWTNAFKADAPSNWARWNLNLAESGEYEVQYYNVPEFARYNSTRYRLKHGASELGITVNLSAGEEGWNSLGTFDFEKGEDQWLAVFDSTPFVTADDQHIIVDAIRLVAVQSGAQTNNGTNNMPTGSTGTTGGENGNNNTNSGTQGNSTDGKSEKENNQNPEILVDEGCSTTGNKSLFFTLFALVFLLPRRKSKLERV